VATAALEAISAAFTEGRFIFAQTAGSEPIFETWDYLQEFVSHVHTLMQRCELTNMRIVCTYDERRIRADEHEARHAE
jgi:hypothetical protein